MGEPERAVGKTLNPAQLVKEAFVLKFFSVEWLKQLEAVASHAYVAPHVKCLEEILAIWEEAPWNGNDEKEKTLHAIEMKRKYAELDSIRFNDSGYSEGVHKAKAGLKYEIRLEGSSIAFIKQRGKRSNLMYGGCLYSLESTAVMLDFEHEIGPAFDIEASIRFMYSITTGKRISQAAKRAKTLQDMSRLLGLDNVYELGPYLQGMSFGAYVAGGCFVKRRQMIPGRDIEDSRAWHFKVKELVGYIYSSRLSRMFTGWHMVEAMTEGETVYYRELDNKLDIPYAGDPRLPSDCLEKYVGGAGFDPEKFGRE